MELIISNSINSIKDHKKANKRICDLLEMVWSDESSFESGAKFCPTIPPLSPPSCQVDVYVKKVLAVFLITQTTTWHACRDLCDNNVMCDYFKWKVKTT